MSALPPNSPPTDNAPNVMSSHIQPRDAHDQPTMSATTSAAYLTIPPPNMLRNVAPNTETFNVTAPFAASTAYMLESQERGTCLLTASAP